MFQTFDSESDSSVGKERVGRLREWLGQESLDGFLVPRADQHQGEYVAPGSERLRWLTGFAGSAGVALILRDRAHIFVDGRYTLQVRHQVDLSIFTIESLVETPPPAWIGKNLGKGARIGFDPRLHTIADAKALRKATEKVGADTGGGRSQPDRSTVDRPAAAAARQDRDPAARLRRRARQGQAGPARRGARQGWRRPHGPYRYVVGRLGLQHPRQRRAAQPGGAGLRSAVGRGAAFAVHRQA